MDDLAHLRDTNGYLWNADTERSNMEQQDVEYIIMLDCCYLNELFCSDQAVQCEIVSNNINDT